MDEITDFHRPEVPGLNPGLTVMPLGQVVPPH